MKNINTFMCRFRFSRYIIILFLLISSVSCVSSKEKEEQKRMERLAKLIVMSQEDKARLKKEVLKNQDEFNVIYNRKINEYEEERRMEYSWLEGIWIDRYSLFGKEHIEELRIGDIFGDGTLMMSIWDNGVKTIEGELEIRGEEIYCHSANNYAIYYPIDVQKHTIYANENRTMVYTYAGKLW